MGAASHELLDINISTNFIEQLLMAASQWSKEKESVLGKARGSYAPYLVQNRTGKSIMLWSGNSTIFNTEDQALRVANGKTADWRFDDWQTTRQVGMKSSCKKSTLLTSPKAYPTDELWHHFPSVARNVLARSL